MSNTIELLETIGKNASLRHAPQDKLAQTLAGLNASEDLQLATASGDSSYLNQELGYRALETPHSVSQTAPEEEEFEPNQQNDGDGNDTDPRQDDKNKDV